MKQAAKAARTGSGAPSDAPHTASGAEHIKRRLPWLVAARLVVATVLLGGTLLLATDAGLGITSYTPRLLWMLGVGTYLASLLQALGMRHTRAETAATVHIAWDLILVAGLVYVSGGLTSVFSFLYGVVVLMAAILMSRTALWFAAVASILLYAGLGSGLAMGWLPSPPDQAAERYLAPLSQIAFFILSNTVGLTLVALLGDNLAGRLRRAGGELKRAEQSAAELALLNEGIIRSLTSGLMTTDLGGKIRSINRAGADMLRSAPSSLRGRSADALLPLPRSEPGTPLLVTRGDGLATRPEGDTFPVGYTATALMEPDGGAMGTLISFQDLTEIAELREARDRAERLAALGQLAAGLAHEIRNPLSSISGSVELVRESSDLDTEDSHLLGIVLREVERLNDLLTTMLGVGRPKEPTFARTRIDLLAHDVVEVAKRGNPLTSGVEITFQAPTEDIDAIVDADQIRQVLWNLLKNASHAAHPRGHVTVYVQQKGKDEVELSVSDDGDGISNEERGRVFDMFYSGRPHGVGLGLALVKQIVDAHCGAIDVESQPGTGTTFRVRLPLAQPKSGGARPAAAASASSGSL